MRLLNIVVDKILNKTIQISGACRDGVYLNKNPNNIYIGEVIGIKESSEIDESNYFNLEFKDGVTASLYH